MRRLLAQSEMIVVRADDHVLFGFARQIAGHVVHGLYPRSRSTLPEPGSFRERERRGCRSLSMALHDLFELLPAADEPARRLRRDLHERNAGVGRAGCACRSPRAGRIRWMVGAIVDQDHAARAVVLGVDDFAEEVRVLGVHLCPRRRSSRRTPAAHGAGSGRSCPSRRCRRSRRNCTRPRRDPVSGEHHAARHFPARGEVERDEIVLELQCSGLAGLRVSN